MRFVLFFGIVLSIYSAANYYVFLRGRLLFPAGSLAGRLYLPLFLLLAGAYLAGRLLEGVRVFWLSNLLVRSGSLWLAAVLYFVLLLGLVDLVSWIARKAFSNPFPNPSATRLTVGLAICGIVVALVVVGHVNSRRPVLRTVEIDIPLRGRPMPALPNPLVVALASDIHVGTTLGPAGMGRIVELLNAENPDLVLLAGDIVDEDMGPVLKKDIGEKLLQLRSRLGVYAITGNHEYIGGVEKACRYLAEHRVRMLRDQWVNLHGLWIIGREDLSIKWSSGRARVPLETLLRQAAPAGPVILMDHQPFGLEAASSAGMDVQVSGHTHHGQLWPFNYITGWIYEKDWGYLRKENTHYYISCGAGTWGPPVRTTSRPEVLCLKLRFVNDPSTNHTNYTNGNKN